MSETTTAQTMAILAELVLMATRHKLPMPMYLIASEKNSQLNLTLNNRADFEAWHAVFGGGRLWECAPTVASPSVLVTNMHSGSLLGWSVNLQASVPPPLSPEVLAALGEAARADAAVLVGEAVAVLDEPKAEEPPNLEDFDFGTFTESRPNGAKVIDEQGNAQQWTAVYWRYHAKYDEECDSLQEALDFLGAGEDAGSLSSDSILGPDGSVLIGRDEIHDAVFGMGRFAPESREQTLRELGGAS